MKSLSINLLSNLQNSNRKNQISFLNKSNNYSLNILNQLKKSGFILGFKTFFNRNNIPVTRVFTKRGFNNKKSFDCLYFYSKTSKTIHVTYKELVHLQNITFSGVIFLETSNYGVLNHFDALKYSVGGKLLLVLV